ncbi:sulfotransferase [Vibrio breoganii]
MKFFIITGSMRTGTTLLSELFEKMPPSNLSLSKIALMGDKSGVVRNLLRSKIGDLSDLSGLKRLIVEEVARHVDITDCDIIGAKQTELFENEIDNLKVLFDDVLVIVTLRDPRDVYCSNYKRRFNKVGIPSSFCMLFPLLHYFINVRKKSQIVVRYEDLVEYPQKTLQSVLEKLNLSAKTQNFEFINSVSSNSSYCETVGVGSISDFGVVNTSVGAYKNQLSVNDSLLIQALFEEVMLENGYQCKPLELNKRKDYLIQWAKFSCMCELDTFHKENLVKVMNSVFDQFEIDDIFSQFDNVEKDIVENLRKQNTALRKRNEILLNK